MAIEGFFLARDHIFVALLHPLNLILVMELQMEVLFGIKNLPHNSSFYALNVDTQHNLESLMPPPQMLDCVTQELLPPLTSIRTLHE